MILLRGRCLIHDIPGAGVLYMILRGQAVFYMILTRQEGLLHDIQGQVSYT